MRNTLAHMIILILFSYNTNSYGKENNNSLNKVFSNEGYPYKMLIQRTEEVKLIYNETKPMTCRVEVRNKGQVWQGQSHSTSEKRFLANPLARCMDRKLAKEIVRTTF